MLVVLATGGGIGWALALTGDGDEAPGSTTGTSSVDPTVAPSTATTLTSTTTVPRSTHTTVGSTTTSAAKGSSTTQPRSRSLLRETMARPDGVAALMDVGFGAGPGDEDCSGFYPEARKPTLGMGFDGDPSVAKLQIAQPLLICLLGFQAGAPIQVTVRSPAGRLEQMKAVAPSCAAMDCTPLTGWAALPGDPLGRYDVKAVQGDLSATGRITVKAADEPRLMVVGSTGDDLMARVTVRPGAAIGIAIAGMHPRRSIGLLFFHTPSFEWCAESCTSMRFRAATTVALDAAGGAIFRLRTSPTDPPGCYVVNTWPPYGALFFGLSPPYPPDVWHSENSSHQFCLRR